MNEATTIYLRWPIPGGGRIELDIVTDQPMDAAAWASLGKVTADIGFLLLHLEPVVRGMPAEPSEDEPDMLVNLARSSGLPPHARE